MSWDKRINGPDGTSYVLDIHHRAHRTNYTNFNITIYKEVGKDKFPMETVDLQFNMKTKEFSQEYIYSPFVESLLGTIKKTLLSSEGKNWGIIGLKSLLRAVSMKIVF